MKKILQHIDKQTPHKERLALVILFGVFAFTVLMDLIWYAETTIAMTN